MERKTFSVIDSLFDSDVGGDRRVASWPTAKGDVVVTKRKGKEMESYLVRGGRVYSVNPKQVELYYPDKIKNL